MPREVRVPHPGKGFAFRWRTSWWPYPRVFGAGQVLSLEPDIGVVHVRVFAFSGDSSVLAGSIGHLPILASRLSPTIVSETGQEPVPTACWPFLNAWREAHGRNLAGAFGVYLGRAVDLIWETIASAGDGANADNTWVETAYPERSPNGSYRKVRAVGQRLDQTADA